MCSCLSSETEQSFPKQDITKPDESHVHRSEVATNYSSSKRKNDKKTTILLRPRRQIRRSQHFKDFIMIKSGKEVMIYY